MIRILVYLFFILLSLGQLARISFLGQQVNGYLYEPVLTVLLSYFIYRYGIKPLVAARENIVSMFVLIGVFFASFLIGLSRFLPLENFVSFLYLLRLVLYLLFFVYLSYALKKDSLLKKSLSTGVLLFALIVLLTSLIQYMFYHELRNLIYLGWDPHLYRMFGTFMDTSVAAAIYGILFFYVYFYTFPVGQNKYLKPAMLLTLLVCIILSFSRTTYVAFLFMFFYLLAVQKKYLLTALVVVFFIGVLLVIPKPSGEGVNLARTFSIESRLKDYKEALSVWQKQPLLGYGYNRVRYVRKQLNLIEPAFFDQTHAGASYPSFLLVLVTTGAVGLTAFLWMIAQIVRGERTAAFFVLFVSILSLADNILLHPFILILLLSIISLTVVNRPSGRLP